MDDLLAFHASEDTPSFLASQEKTAKKLGIPGSDGENGESCRLDLLIEGARLSGFTIDALDYLSRGLSDSALRIFIGNASRLPSYMKSSDSPYLFRSASAPSNDTR